MLRQVSLLVSMRSGMLRFDIMRFRGSFNALNLFLQFLLRVFDLVVATI